MFLSHDVDWRRQGAPLEHIYVRKDRFDDKILKNMAKSNPYYNLPDYMDIEDKFGVKSTFFFRTEYENGIVQDYEDDLRDLSNGGWEIGLHTSPKSIDSMERIANEKRVLEELAKTTIYGNRVHYLGFNKGLPKKLKDLGFIYDSTVRHSKDRINEKEMGYTTIDGILEFPITLMDAYIFTYLKLREEQIIKLVNDTVDICKNLDSGNVFTLIWHDCSLKMKGGRIYPRILEFLSSMDSVELCRGIDLANSILNGELGDKNNGNG